MTQLPTNEGNYAIGQWGPIVSSALVIIAAIINQASGWYHRRVKAARQRKEEAQKIDAMPVESPTFELADRAEGQQTGVVKPGLAHVSTLKDMQELMNARR